MKLTEYGSSTCVFGSEKTAKILLAGPQGKTTKLKRPAIVILSLLWSPLYVPFTYRCV